MWQLMLNLTSTMAARKRSHCHTWAHINPAVHRVPRRVSIQPTYNQDRTWFNIHVTLHKVHKYSSIHQSTIKSYYKLGSNKVVAEAIKVSNEHLTSLFKYYASLGSQPQKHNRGINKKCLAQGPTPRPWWDRSSSYSSHDTSYYLQQWKINPEYKKVLS